MGFSDLAQNKFGYENFCFYRTQNTKKPYSEKNPHENSFNLQILAGVLIIMIQLKMSTYEFFRFPAKSMHAISEKSF